MIGIIDYGVGNLFSLQSSLKFIGQEAIVTGDKNEIEKSDALILPGVGAFGDAALKLQESGLVDTVLNEVKKGKKLLGICLGMQLLFDESLEYGSYKGLGLIPGKICPIEDVISKDLKVPQMGWNQLKFNKESNLFKYIKEGDFVYFVHSYYANTDNENIIATTEYGASLTAAVEKDNVMGCQFHPEKSGNVGLNILKAFCEMKG